MHGKIRRRDAENMTHEVRVELRGAVHHHAAPVMAAEDDAGIAQFLGDACDAVRVVAEREVGEIGRGARFAVANAVDGYAA